VQYLAPLFRRLAREVDLRVFYAHRATPSDQARAGFGVGFDWDVDLLSGYDSAFLVNRAASPSVDRFGGCDTPEIGRLLAAGSFDSVVVEGWYLKCMLQAAFAAKRRGIRVLARGDSHLLTPRSPLKQAAKAAIYPLFLRLFDAALYAGVRSRDYWLHYRYPAEKLFFSPHGVDAEWFRSRATGEARSSLRTRLGIGPDAYFVILSCMVLVF
jgi:hypothetical protein